MNNDFSRDASRNFRIEEKTGQVFLETITVKSKPLLFFDRPHYLLIFPEPSNPSFTIPLSNFSFVLIIIVRLFAWRGSHHSNKSELLLFALLILSHFSVSRCFFDSLLVYISVILHSFPFDLSTSSTFNPTILFPLQTLWLIRQTFKSVDEFFFFSYRKILTEIEKNFFLRPKRSCANFTDPFSNLFLRKKNLAILLLNPESHEGRGWVFQDCLIATRNRGEKCYT